MMSWEPVPQNPSYYDVDVHRSKISIVLLTKYEAASQECWDQIEQNLKKRILGVACAAGYGRPRYPRNLPDDCILEVPIQYEGKETIRSQGFARLIRLVFQASVENKVILIHCNQSFHRGPLLFAAVLSKLGKTLVEAFRFIAEKRTIFAGHLLHYHSWPAQHRSNDRAKKMLSAYDFVRSVHTTEQDLEREYDAWMSGVRGNAAVRLLPSANRWSFCDGCRSEVKDLRECRTCGEEFCRTCNFWCSHRVGGCGLVLCNDCNGYSETIGRNSRGLWMCRDCDYRSSGKRQRR